MNFRERDEALRILFTETEQSDPEDRQGVAWWARSLIWHVQDLCAKRAEFGDCTTGMGCAEGYHPESMTAQTRKKAADDIRALRWGPDYYPEDKEAE